MKQHLIEKLENTRNTKNLSTSMILGVLLIGTVFLTTMPDANAHLLCSKAITTGSNPVGNVMKGTDVWVALSGTGQLLKFPISDCTTNTYYTVGGDPTFLTVSGANRIVFTEANSLKIGVWRTDTNTLERTVTLTNNPRDIVTDPSNSDKVWFTETNTNKFASMIASTGVVTQITLPDANSRPNAISVDSNYVFISDIINNKIYRYEKSTGTITSKVITDGYSYGITLDNTNAQVWGSLYVANKLFDLPKTMGSYSTIPGHSSTSGMYRVDMAATDVLVTYKTIGKSGAIHVNPPGAYHDADSVGANAMDVLYNPDGGNNPGSFITIDGSTDYVKRYTHFPS